MTISCTKQSFLEKSKENNYCFGKLWQVIWHFTFFNVEGRYTVVRLICCRSGYYKPNTSSCWEVRTYNCEALWWQLHIMECFSSEVTEKYVWVEGTMDNKIKILRNSGEGTCLGLLEICGCGRDLSSTPVSSNTAVVCEETVRCPGMTQWKPSLWHGLKIALSKLHPSILKNSEQFCYEDLAKSSIWCSKT